MINIIIGQGLQQLWAIIVGVNIDGFVMAAVALLFPYIERVFYSVVLWIIKETEINNYTLAMLLCGLFYIIYIIASAISARFEAKRMPTPTQWSKVA